MLFFFVRDSYRPAYGKLDVLISILLKPLILPQLLLLHWSHKGQYAIVCNWNSLLSYQLTLIAEIYSLKSESIERHSWFVYGATGEKNWHASYFDIWHTGCVYFCNVLGENQYFPFEAYPKSGFSFLFFNFSFCCIVALSFCNLLKLKMLMDCCSSCMQAPIMWN